MSVVSDGLCRAGAVSTFVRWVAGVAVALVAVLVAAPAAGAAPFSCTPPRPFVSQDTPAQLNELITQPSGATTFSPIGAPTAGADYAAAIAFNPRDRFIYGIDAGDNRLVRIDSSATVTALNLVLPAGFINAAAFDESGALFAMNYQTTTLYRIDVARRSPSTRSRSTRSPPADLTFIAGYLWGVARATGSSSSSFVRIDPQTGHVDRFAQTRSCPTASPAPPGCTATATSA